MFLAYLLIVGGFVLTDFAFVHVVKSPAPGSILATILAFFNDVNTKALTTVNTVFNELISNFHEYGILAVVFMVGGPVIFVQAIIGYLGVRLAPDVISSFGKKP